LAIKDLYTDENIWKIHSVWIVVRVCPTYDRPYKAHICCTKMYLHVQY